MKCFFRINHRCRQRELASEASLFVRVLLSMMVCEARLLSPREHPIPVPACVSACHRGPVPSLVCLTQAHSAAPATMTITDGTLLAIAIIPSSWPPHSSWNPDLCCWANMACHTHTHTPGSSHTRWVPALFINRHSCGVALAQQSHASWKMGPFCVCLCAASLPTPPIVQGGHLRLRAG